MKSLKEYLELAVQDGASDIFLIAGSAVSQKLEGQIVPMEDEKIFPPQTKQLISEIYELAGKSMDEYMATGDDDFSFAVSGLARFRVNTYRQRGSLAAVIRIVSFEIPDWQEMNIPEEVMNLAATTLPQRP